MYLSFSKVIAIDIGTHNIKIIQAKTKKSKIKVNKYLIFDTPSNAVEDGYILDVDSLALQIKKKLKFNRIKAKNAVVTITGTSIITREIILPKASIKELGAIVNNEAPHIFPVDTNDYILDYKILEEIIADNTKQYRILVVAVPNRMIEGYVNLMDKCGLKIHSIDYMGNSLSKFVNNQETQMDKQRVKITDNNQTICAIDMGSHMTTVIIMEKGILKFVRMFSYDGQQFAREVTENFNLSSEIQFQKAPDDSDVLSNQQLYEQLKNSNINVPGFIKEVASVFNFYYSRDKQNIIDKIYLVGGSSKIKDIDKYFESIFSIKTECIKEFTNVKYSKRCNGFKEVQAHFIGCLGALINK